MKLYYSPNACSIGIHILLEEIGATFDAEAIDVRAGQQFTPAFRSVNPKGKVPALVRDDGRLLTEFSAIAFWLARTNPEADLLPKDVDGEIRVQELLDYMVASIHMRGFALIIAAPKFVSDPVAQDELRAMGRKVVTEGLQTLSAALGDKDFLMGSFSIADAALFYLTHWAAAFGIDTPDNLSRFYARMKDRPAVQRVFAREQATAA
jgi:glutathione S-transferase